MSIHMRQVYRQMKHVECHSHSNHNKVRYEYATVKPILALNSNEQVSRHAHPSLVRFGSFWVRDPFIDANLLVKHMWQTVVLKH